LAGRAKLVNERQEKRLEIEKAAIKDLLDRVGRDYEITDSGFGYYLLKEGSGPKPEVGDTVHFYYSIEYTDGTELEGDIGYSGEEGKSFVLGKAPFSPVGRKVLPCYRRVPKEGFVSLLPVLLEHRAPTIKGDWWRIADNPDLGPYNLEKQQPLDFGVWQAANGSCPLPLLKLFFTRGSITSQR